MALFLGVDLDEKYQDLEGAKKNAFYMEQISRMVADANLETFKGKIQEKLSESHQELIQERPQDQPFVDAFGRVTYLYVVLYGIQFPIYQPGSVMFETAILSETESSVVAGGSQQNGPILGNGCAIFLAKFLCTIILTYQELCQNQENPSELSKTILKEALSNTLTELALEDVNEHGRLLTMKQQLLELLDDEVIEEPLLCLF